MMFIQRILVLVLTCLPLLAMAADPVVGNNVSNNTSSLVPNVPIGAASATAPGYLGVPAVVYKTTDDLAFNVDSFAKTSFISLTN